jgi:UDP-N-acetyl-D-mannosaminuronate dehydrogenase
MGAELSFHDPYVNSWQVDGVDVPDAGDDLAAALADADLAIVLADHTVYDPDTLTRHARLLFDTRGRTRDHAAARADLVVELL